MAEFVRAKDNYTGTEREVSTEWIERWPEDYTVLNTDPVQEKPARTKTPVDGKHEKEQG